MNTIKRISNYLKTQPWEGPIYFYDQSILARQIEKLMTGKPDNLNIYYAMKGNSNLGLLQFFQAQGLGVEIASGGELFLAEKAGFKKDHIIYTGPCKTDQELTAALGIEAIHVESLNEAVRLNALCAKKRVTQKILVRINADFEVKTKIQLSGCPSPFGISEEDFTAVMPQILALDHLDFQGIHVYNASGVMDYQLLLQNVENVFHLVARTEKDLGVNIPVIDFGGGFGIDYSAENRHVDVPSFYVGLNELIEAFGYADRVLVMEIARYLVAESGFYVTKVQDKKYSRGTNFLITDGGIQHLLRVSLFGENHETTVINQAPTTDTERVNITGSLCTNIDVLAQDIELPKTEIGDYVVVLKAGCYGLNAAMNHFLCHAMPQEILMSENDFREIRKRGKPEDLLLNMTGWHDQDLQA